MRMYLVNLIKDIQAGKRLNRLIQIHNMTNPLFFINTTKIQVKINIQ